MGILGSSSKVKSKSVLSTDQQALLKKTTGTVGKGLDSGASAYTGQLSADTPDILSKAFELAKSVFSGDSFETITKALTGQAAGIPAYVFDPAGITNEWRENFANPAMEMYKSEILPMVIEQYNLPGMAYSSVAARGVSNSINNFYGQNVLPTLYNSLQTGRKNAFQSGEAAAGRQLSGATALANLPNLAVGGVAEAAQIQIANQQRGLDAAYREFLRLAPENNPWMQYASGLSTSPTVENIGVQGSSMLGDLIKTGAAIGLAPTTGGGSLFGNWLS